MKSKKLPWRTFVCLTLPVLILLLPFAFRRWKHNQRYFVMGGGWKTQAGGEKACLAGLSLDLRRVPDYNILAGGFFTAECDGKYRNQVAHGKRPNREWRYIMEYNRDKKTLSVRRLIVTEPEPKLLKIWVWHNVSEDTIHQIAAPILKLKSSFQIEAYQGGLNELKKYGATLEEPRVEPNP